MLVGFQPQADTLSVVILSALGSTPDEVFFTPENLAAYGTVPFYPPAMQGVVYPMNVSILNSCPLRVITLYWCLL